MVFGGYELDPVSRWEDGVPWDHAARSLPPDFERFAPLMAGAIRRFPFLGRRRGGPPRLPSGRDDAGRQPAARAAARGPGVLGRRRHVAQRLRRWRAGSAGRVSGWITAGDPGVDIGPYRAWRFADTYRDPTFAAGLARETYSDYYRLRYPYDADVAGRPRRLSPLHGRLQEARRGLRDEGGLGTSRPTPSRVGRGAAPGATRRAYGWARAPLVRSGRGGGAGLSASGPALIDLSSFGKIDVTGPRRSRSCSASPRTTSTARSAPSSTRQCSTSAAGSSPTSPSCAWLATTGSGSSPARASSRPTWAGCARTSTATRRRDRGRQRRFATIGLWGPRARDILAAATADAVDDEALPLRQARAIRIGAAHRCSRRGSATRASSAGS